MRVLYCAAECKPFAKMGGVADVAGELPVALRDIGVDIEIALPLYGSVDRRHVGQEHGRFEVHYGGDTEEVRVYKGSLKDVPVFFFQNARFFEGRYSRPYVHSEQTPFLDDIIRFSFFSEALLRFVEDHSPEIVHINDWVLGYLFGRMAMEGLPPKRVLTVHNIGYQGNLYKEHVRDLHIKLLLDDPEVGPLFTDPRLDWDSVNALRLALELADGANTVSPTYCREMTMPENRDGFFEGGKGLHEIARRLAREGRLMGILNGFVYPANPTEEAFGATVERKQAARQTLASRFSDPSAFLLGFVGRAVEQKFGLLRESYQGKPMLEHILDLSGVNVAILATGLPEYEAFIGGIGAKRRPGMFSYDEWLAIPRRENYSCTIAFDRELARTISLGCDVFLMPSLFEPCGITQLESMSNATPPLVRLTGGLADTVMPHPEENATGFGFAGTHREGVLRGLLQCVARARDLRRDDPGAFGTVQHRAFGQRFEWHTAARQYVERLYEPVMAGDLEAPL